MKANVLDLRPLQFVLGMEEVHHRRHRLKKLGKKKFRHYLRKNPIKVVRNSIDELFILDHHHLARVAWELGYKKIHVMEVFDGSNLSEQEFWRLLKKKKYVHLEDQFGLGPHQPDSLPMDVRGLADDPYRSLVWMLIHVGAIEKLDEPFFEFQWATFLRHHLRTRVTIKANFAPALKEATALVRSKKAEQLPGHLGRSSQKKSRL